MASALILFHDLSEGSKLHSGFDLDRSIFFVERYQLNIIFVLLIFFNISVTVQIEDSDIAIFQLILLMNPYDLFIHIDRFHTVAGNTDAEVRGCRDIITDFKFLILIKKRKKEIEYRADIGQMIVPHCKTVKELLEEYVNLYGKEAWALSTYSSNVSMINNYIIPIIGGDKLENINTRFIEKYYQRLLRTRR